MAVVNVTNACVAGAMEGMVLGRSNVSAVSTTYDSMATAAANLALALGTAGFTDVLIDVTSKIDLLMALVAGEVANRPLQNVTNYATMANSILAAYTSAATKLL
jgi:uncharacterized membrane protein YhfC